MKKLVAISALSACTIIVQAAANHEYEVKATIAEQMGT
jgi:hypothetical protein